MLSFNYVIKDKMGIHARPAGLLVKKVKGLDSTVSIVKGEKTVNAGKLMAVMGLGIKGGEEITVMIEGGADEAANFEIMKTFFEENL